MVAVIEEKQSAGAAQCIEFEVYRSPSDPNRILGRWRFAVGGPSGVVIDQSKLDTPVEIEFGRVLDCADQHGISFVWVNDPDELFPSFARG